MYFGQVKDRKDSSKPPAAQQPVGHLHKRSKTGFEKADLSGANTRSSKAHPLLYPQELPERNFVPSFPDRSHNYSVLEPMHQRQEASRDPAKSVVKETKLHINRPAGFAALSRHTTTKNSLMEIQTTSQGQQLQFLQPPLHQTVSSTSFQPSGSKQAQLFQPRLTEKRKNTLASVNNKSDASTPVNRDRERLKAPEVDYSCYSQCIMMLESMNFKEAMAKYEAVIRKLFEKIRALRAENHTLREDNGRVKKLESLLVDQRVAASNAEQEPRADQAVHGAVQQDRVPQNFSHAHRPEHPRRCQVARGKLS